MSLALAAVGWIVPHLHRQQVSRARTDTDTDKAGHGHDPVLVHGAHARLAQSEDVKTSKRRIVNPTDGTPHSPGGASSRSGQLFGAGAAEAKGTAAILLVDCSLRAAGGGMDRIMDVREGNGTLRECW